MKLSLGKIGKSPQGMFLCLNYPSMIEYPEEEVCFAQKFSRTRKKVQHASEIIVMVLKHSCRSESVCVGETVKCNLFVGSDRLI